MLRSRCSIYRILLIPLSKKQVHHVPLAIRLISISGRNIVSNDGVRGRGNVHRDISWPSLCEYAYKSDLLKLKSTEIRDWLKLYDHRIDMNSVQIRDVKCCGQKYITYTTTHYDELYQYVVVRGTKNWKNIRTSLKYTVSYHDEFAMHLHSGYGTASHAILADLKQFVNPMAKMRLTGHSYGGIVCCCIASHFHKNSVSEIDQVVTFGMPQFSTTRNMRTLCSELPLIQVVHVRDEIAKTEWYRTLNRQNDIAMQCPVDSNVESMESTEQSGGNEVDSILYIGQVEAEEDERRFLKNPSMKKPIVHRMGDYVQSIEKHIERQHDVDDVGGER